MTVTDVGSLDYGYARRSVPSGTRCSAWRRCWTKTGSDIGASLNEVVARVVPLLAGGGPGQVSRNVSRFFGATVRMLNFW